MSSEGDITSAGFPAYRLTAGGAASSVVLTCEHASREIPPGYGALGVGARDRADHIAWDIGAAGVALCLGRAFEAPVVESTCSRLVIDCNRDLGDHDLIVEETHGVPVPGNLGIAAAEREHRLAAYYRPYHEAVDAVLAGRRPCLLLSVHSFTPTTAAGVRALDVGVLFDEHSAPAEALGDALREVGFETRYNEPYSGLEGLIFSARDHGRRHDVPYLEIEVNNGLLRAEGGIASVSARLAQALRGALGKMA